MLKGRVSIAQSASLAELHSSGQGPEEQGTWNYGQLVLRINVIGLDLTAAWVVLSKAFLTLQLYHLSQPFCL